MGSCCKSRGGSEANFCTKMILALFLFCFCGIVSCSPVSEVEDRGLVGDIAMGILVGKIQEMLGITTTPKPRAIIDGLAGLLGGETTTTAAPPTDEEKLGLLQTLFSLFFPSADTTTTTAAPTTTKCGGLLGGGLLGCSSNDETTTTTTTTEAP